jgi:hypothetical protein
MHTAEKVIFSRLLKKGPACAEASAGRQMQVELCEIPPAGAPEILSIRPDHGRREAYLAVRRNDLPR